jgi:hypothetical protein
MRTATFIAGLLALGSTLLGCQHDLDKLRQGAGAAGSAGSISLRNDAGPGADAALPQTGSTSLASCEPCSAPPAVAGSSLTGHACCAGATKKVCGSAFDTGQHCYPRAVPGSTDTLCPDAKHGTKTFAGCCRADSECGITVDELGLGCVARADVPPILGGPLVARACVPHCKADADCQAFSDAYICAESDKDKSRFCALGCQRDQDCAAHSGTVCAIQSNTAQNRIDLFCRKPIGAGMQNDACSKPDDCARGACAVDRSVTPARQFCTALCGGDLDCIGGHEFCRATNIPLPDGTGHQPVSICLNQ